MLKFNQRDIKNLVEVVFNKNMEYISIVKVIGVIVLIASYRNIW